jgi:hypothetical protein
MKPSPRRAAKPKQPERDFAPPPPEAVVWVVLDRQNTENRREAFAQTAYRAFELSGIARDGQRLSYGECHVFYSEHSTRKKWVDALVDALQRLCAPRKSNGHSKLNGKSNGRRS